MERLRELLLKWDEGTISKDESQELKTLLRDTENRREMVDEFFLSGEISEYLKTPEPVPPQPPRKVALGRFAKASWLHYGLNRLRALKSEIR